MDVIGGTSPRTARRRTRPAPLALAVAVAATVTLATTAPARAADAADASVTSSLSFAGGNACPLTKGVSGMFQTVPYTLGAHGAKKIDVTESGTSVATNTGDTNDVAKLHAVNSVTGALRSAAGSITTATVAVHQSGSLRLRAGLGTDCAPVAGMDGSVLLAFAVTKPGTLTYRISVPRDTHVDLETAIVGSGADTTTQDDLTHGQQTITRKVRPGTYQVGLHVTSELAYGSGVVALSHEGTTTFTATFARR